MNSGCHNAGRPADGAVGACVAFLASRMDPDRHELNRLRESIYNLGQELRQPIWVAEVSSPELATRSLEEAQIRCLQYVRDIPEFICIVDGSYGTPWNLAQLCVLELEIFAAALAGKPFHFFLLGPSEADHRTETLLRAIRLAKPEVARARASSPEDILAELRSRFYERSVSASAARQRDRPPSEGASSDGGDLDVRFLNGDFMPIGEGPPDKHIIRELLSASRLVSDQATRLVSTWMAIRHLCAAPYSDPNQSDFLPLWDEALSQWASAAAWYGLHGHHYLGRLAAVNSLLFIRSRMVEKSIAPARSIHGTYGARASEYYSMAKQASSRTTKRRLLSCALADVNRALEAPAGDTSGLLAIRGSVLQALGHRLAGLRDYNKVLQIRSEKGEDAGRIGEARAELGMGYLRVGRIWKAGRLLTEGVADLERSGRHEFTVRALRKLSIFYVVTLRRRRALQVMTRARDLAAAQEIRDQLRQIIPVLKLLESFTWRSIIALLKGRIRGRRRQA